MEKSIFSAFNNTNHKAVGITVSLPVRLTTQNVIQAYDTQINVKPMIFRVESLEADASGSMEINSQFDDLPLLWRIIIH